MMAVILVDDDKDLREVMHVLLASRFDVRVFDSGRPAVEALLEDGAHLILSDLDLPGLTGEEVARVAGSVEPRPWIVLMSGDYARLERARPLADATLLKPFSIKELLQACLTERES
jgi:DNA-binding response OmpR family regulator